MSKRSNHPPTDLSGRIVDDLPEALGEELMDGPTVAPDEDRNDPEPLDHLTMHDLMVRMQRGLLEDLLGRLEDSTATHQELAIIQRMLQDAGYVVERPDYGSGSQASPGAPARPALGLPDLAPPEEEE